MSSLCGISHIFLRTYMWTINEFSQSRLTNRKESISCFPGKRTEGLSIPFCAQNLQKQNMPSNQVQRKNIHTKRKQRRWPTDAHLNIMEGLKWARDGRANSPREEEEESGGEENGRMASMQGLYIEERGEEIFEEFNDACIFCYGIFVRNPRLESTRFCVPLVQNSPLVQTTYVGFFF